MPCFNRWQKNCGGATRQLACGQCIGCKLEYARQWAVRCVNEAQLYKHNAFITLTYDDAHLPSDNGLHYEHFQTFIKRLRKTIERNALKSKTEPTNGKPPCSWITTKNRIEKDGNLRAKHTHEEKEPRAKNRKQNTADVSMTTNKKNEKTTLRFYMAGEYGDKTGRPHYHALLFNHRFEDQQVHSETAHGKRLYTSAELTKHWPWGFSSIGEVNFETASYIARYIAKKITGDQANNHYQVLDLATGEITTRAAEFSQMSRRPGIGHDWIEKYRADVYPHGAIVINGHETKPPRYYDNWHKARAPRAHTALQTRRTKLALEKMHDNTNPRLDAKEEVKEAQLQQLKRTL